MPDTTCFIFVESEVDKRGKLYKAVKDKGRVVEMGRQDEKTLIMWLAGQMKREGKRVQESTLRYLLAKTGTDMENLEKEFTRMVSEHKDTIYMVCYMFSKDNAEVEDLYQEILINLWRSLPKFEQRSSVKTWIWRISLNTCISIDRKKRRRSSLPLELDIDLYNDSDRDTKQIKMLHDRINRLGVFDRAIILLWLENMSYEEIGAIVGISTKNVSVRLYRIKEQLKTMK